VILNRVKEGVHGFPGDGTLLKSIRSALLIDMQNADHVMTRAEVISPFKLLFNVGDGSKQLITPAIYEALVPQNQYIVAYSIDHGVWLKSEASAITEYLFGGSHIEWLSYVGIFIATRGYSQIIKSFHGGIFNFSESISFSLSNLFKTHIYEGGGGHTITLDGSLPWPDNSKIVVSNIGGELTLSAINGATIVNAYLVGTSSFKLLKQGATNNWYCVTQE
jgi:hypothetical protein